MRPSRCAFMVGSTALIMVKKPKTLSRSCRSRASRVVLSTVPRKLRAGIVDEDVDPPKFLHDRVDKFLDSILVDDIGRHAEHGALFRQFGDGSVKLSGVATANCN